MPAWSPFKARGWTSVDGGPPRLQSPVGTRYVFRSLVVGLVLNEILWARQVHVTPNWAERGESRICGPQLWVATAAPGPRPRTRGQCPDRPGPGEGGQTA